MAQAEEAAAPQEPPATKTISISPPQVHAGETYSEIVLREPTVEQMEEVDTFRGVRWTRELTERVSAIPKAVLLKLGIRTLNECSAYLTLFTDAGLPTATNS